MALKLKYLCSTIKVYLHLKNGCIEVIHEQIKMSYPIHKTPIFSELYETWLVTLCLKEKKKVSL